MNADKTQIKNYDFTKSDILLLLDGLLFTQNFMGYQIIGLKIC